MEKRRLLDEVREVIRIKNYSYRTEKSYIRWIRKFILFHQKRHPRDMAEPEIRQFLNYLADNQKVAASTQNQALSAILFLYKKVLQKEIGFVQAPFSSVSEVTAISRCEWNSGPATTPIAESSCAARTRP